MHVAIQREMGLLPTPHERGDRERHKYLIWLLKNTYEKANYGKPRRRWLQLHSVPRGDRLRNLLATAEPCGYRTKSDGEEDAHVVIDLDNPSGPVVSSAEPKRRQIPADEVGRLIRETLFDSPRRRNAIDSFEQAGREQFDKATQTDALENDD